MHVRKRVILLSKKDPGHSLRRVGDFADDQSPTLRTGMRKREHINIGLDQRPWT